jgi:glucokinase
VGGTKTNLALFKIEENEIFLLSEKSYKTKDYASLLEVMHNFLGKNSLKIDIISLEIAGPIHQGKVRGTNFSWEIDSEELIREFYTT